MCLHLLRFLQMVLDRKQLRAALWTERKSIWKLRWETKRNGTFWTLLRRGHQATPWKVTLRTTRTECSFLMYVNISFYFYFFVVLYILIYCYKLIVKCDYSCHNIKNKYAMGMHRNENSWLKPKSNKMKHWAEGRISNTFFPPCIFPKKNSPLHKLNSQNVLFSVLSYFSKKKIHFVYILANIIPTKHNFT